MRQQKIKMLIVLAEIYGEDMTETRIEVYLKVLSDLSIDECKHAFDAIMKNIWIKKMPLPAEIREAARPSLKPKDEAIRRITKIKDAIIKFGWPSPEKAEKFLGEIIWGDVMRIGGWKYLCESPNANINDSMIYAQMRDGLQSSIQAERDGIDYDIPAIPSKGQNRLSDLVKELADKKSLSGGNNGQ